MPEIASIQTDWYDLIIWSDKLEIPQQRLRKTLESRDKVALPSVIYFSPDLVFDGKAVPVSSKTLGSPVFFENRMYDIEFIFHPETQGKLGSSLPAVSHRLKSVEESFHFIERTSSLRATINTGNNIGWFKFDLHFTIDGRKIKQSFSFEVLPVKMDMSSDLSSIYDQIDRVYPLWRYSIAEQTYLQMKAVKKPHPQFLLMWLAQFELCRKDFIKGLRFILNSPHSRLVNIEKKVKMDRLKGRLTPRLENDISQAQVQKLYDRRFSVTSKTLSVDTVENRFIKHVISTSVHKLCHILTLLKNEQEKKDSPRLSNDFIDKLDTWQKELRTMLYRPLFKEIGKYSGISRESLVLQQKPGYSRVYRVWQQLKWYLELLDGQNSLSFRNVAELYEVWCFLEIRRILLDLGFEEQKHRKAELINSGLQVDMTDGMAGAFRFKRDDGIKLRLAHEPVFGKKGSPIRSWLVTQKPDILLEATFPDGCKFIWLFDAKYRIKGSGDESKESYIDDMVPDDAINQMHRYRDALIYLHDNPENSSKSRPVFGAYALYPGFYDQQTLENPYKAAIDEIGVGAFSLLPGEDNKGSYWLQQFLENKLTYSKTVSDAFFVEEAPRIPYQGTSVSRYRNLTIVASQLGPDRNKDYIDSFIKGEAKYYHTRGLAFSRQRIEEIVVAEAEYLAVSVQVDPSSSSLISHVYPIKNAKPVKRRELTEEQTGTVKISDPDEDYWLFELGKSLSLKSPLEKTPGSHFRVELVDLLELTEADAWNQVNSKYASLRI